MTLGYSVIRLFGYSDDCHRRRCSRYQCLRAVSLAEHVGFAEVHGASGFDYAPNGAESVAEAFGKVANLDLGRDRVFILAHQGKAGKAGSNIGDRGRHAAMDEAELLLVYLA